MILVCIICIIFAALICLAAALIMKEKDISGSWKREINLTDEAVNNIAMWMADIEGEEITFDWVKSQTEDIVVPVVLEVQKSDQKTGEFKQYVDQADYEVCEKQVETLLASCMEDVLSRKLEQAGYGDNLDPTKAGEIAEEVLGSSVEDYLKDMGIDMLPSYESFAENLNISGVYTLDKGTMLWESAKGTFSKTYVKQKDFLIFPDEEMIFRKQVEQ